MGFNDEEANLWQLVLQVVTANEHGVFRTVVAYLLQHS